MPTNNPRFRTAHEAGKYIAAQLYPAGQALGPDEFGAVPKVLPNPAWDYAQFEAVEAWDGLRIVDRFDRHKGETKTSSDWYKEYQAQGYTIIFADGWDDILDFHGCWNYGHITREEFESRLHNSTLDIQCK